MCERIMDENVDATRNNKESRGTEITFFAYRLIFFVTMENRRTLSPIIELGTLHFFQRGQIFEQLIDAQRLTLGQLFNDCFHAVCFAPDNAKISRRRSWMEELSLAAKQIGALALLFAIALLSQFPLR